MSFLIKAIRDHYMIYCNCDGINNSGIWEGRIAEIPKNYNPEFLLSCGIVSTGFFEGRFGECHNCKSRYHFRKFDEELARQTREAIKA